MKSRPIEQFKLVLAALDIPLRSSIPANFIFEREFNRPSELSRYFALNPNTGVTRSSIAYIATLVERNSSISVHLYRKKVG